MAIENAKTLNVRIRNKYDSYENWAGSSLVLEPGEIAIAYTTVNVTVDNGTAKHPALLMKVGNGTDTFDKLPWLSAKAADVVEACKDQTALTAFVNNVIANAGIATNEAMNALSGRVTTAEGAIDALEALVGTDSVEDQIEAAIAALNLETTYVKQETDKSLMTTAEHTKLAGISEGANKVEKSDTNGNIKVDGAEVVVYTHPEKHAIADVTGLQDALDGKDAAGAAAQALKDAKDYADGLDSAMDGRVDVLEDAVSETGIIASRIGDAKAEAKKYADDLAGNYDAAGTAAAAVKELADNQVKANTDAIALLNGDGATAGSVNYMVGQAKQELNGKIGNIEDLETSAAALNIVAAINEVKGEVDAVEVDMGDVDGLSTTNKTVVGAINEVLAAVGTGGTAAVVTVTTDTTTDGALKSYTIKQGNATVGVIDIPKDMVVESGSVVTNPEGQTEGTYIKLVLANVADPLYINVGHLVDIYTAKASAQQVQIAIDSTTREISATIVAGSVGTTELADNAVTTAKIADANVTKAKLSTDVQASLDKADAAATAIATHGDIVTRDADEFATSAQGAKADTAVQSIKVLGTTLEDGDELTVAAAQTALGLGTAAYTGVDAIVGSVVGTADDTKDSNTVHGAKKYADALDTAMDARVDELEGTIATHGDIVTHDAEDFATAAQGAKADSAVQSVVTGDNNGTIKVDGTEVAVAGLGSAAYADTTAFDAAGAADDAKAAVIGQLGDATTASTIYGAKAYADLKIGDAINALDSSVAATAADGNQVSVLTGVTQADGKLTDKTEVKLAAIALTGSTDSLQQGALTLVFDCGGAGV